MCLHVKEATDYIFPVTYWTEKLEHCIQNANRVFPGSGTSSVTSCSEQNADRK